MADPIKMTRAQFEAAGGKLDEPLKMTRAEFAAAGGNLDTPADHPVQAAGEGALNTGTLGLSGKLQADYYRARQSPDLAKQRAEANPVAHVAGELAGLFTPGPGVIGDVGRAAGGLAKGVKTARLVSGGVEGGLWGLSAAMNEDHMGDPRLAGENVAAGVFGGALAGMGINTVFGKIGDLSKSALVKAFGGKALKDTLGGLAEDAVIKSVATEKDLGRRNLEKRSTEVARGALDNGYVKGGASMKEAAGRADSHAGELFNEVQKHLDVADTMGAFDPGAAAARLQGKVAEMDNNPALSAKKAKLQGFVDELRDTGTPGSPAVPARNALDEVKTFDKATNQWKILQPAQSAQAAKAAVAPRASTAPETFAKAWETITSMKSDPDLYRLRGELQDEIFNQVSAINPELGAGLKDTNRAHANALEFRTLAENKAAKEGYTMGDYAAGALGFHAGGLPGAVVPAAKRLVRERGGFVAASALDALAQSGTLPKVAQGFQLLMKSRLADPAFGGPFRAVLETAASKGAQELLQTHLSLAQQDPEYMANVGLEHEDPETVAAHTDRAHRLSLLQNTVDQAGQAIDQHVGRLLGSVPGRAPSYKSTEPTMAQYQAIKKQLEVLASNAENNPHLADLAPTTASLAQLSTQAGAAYLLGKAPKNPTEGLPPAFQRPWKPGKAELRDWMRMVDVVANPMSVLDSARRGVVHQDELETVKTVYPRLFREFQDKLSARLAEWTVPLDRKRRGQASLFLGDLENPAVTQMIQAAHQRAIPPPAPAPDGRQKIDVDKSNATEAQKLQEK